MKALAHSCFAMMMPSLRDERCASSLFVPDRVAGTHVSSLRCMALIALLQSFAIFSHRKPNAMGKPCWCRSSIRINSQASICIILAECDCCRRITRCCLAISGILGSSTGYFIM